MNEINFEIVNVFREPNTNIIKYVQWLALIPGIPNNLGISGSTALRPPTNETIPFTEVTQEQLVIWIKEALGSQTLEGMFAALNLRKQKFLQVAPTGLVSGLPPSLVTETSSNVV